MTASSADEPLLRVAGLKKDFYLRSALFTRRTVHHAVDGVSLEVRRGETLGIVGESGCGKSTLAKMILGMLVPTAGTIHYRGDPVESLGRLARTGFVQPIFQDPYSSLNPRRRIVDIVGLPLVAHGVDRREIATRTAAMLERVGLPGRAARAFPRQLSGGQRQRVAIARALILRPHVVICDEPTSALDVSVQAQILSLLLELQDDFGLSYIFISHNLAVVEHLADRVAVMYAGKIVETGMAADVFRTPQDDYTRSLLASSLSIDAYASRQGSA